MSTWVIYARCSTEEQAKEGLSIEMQVNNCQKVLAGIPGAVYGGSYIDEGLSGSDAMHRREALMHLLDGAKKKKFDGVVVYKADRLSRLSQDRENLVQVFARYGIEVLSYSGEKLMDNSPQGEFIRRMLANIDELEVKTLSFRVKNAMALKAENGEWKGGHPPYGYRWDREQEKMLPVNEEVAGHIRKIYHMYVYELEGGLSILNYLLENNVPYYKDGKKEKWNKERVYSVLKSPFYCGYQYHNTRYGKFDPVPNRKHKKQEEWQLYPAPFVEPVISREIWDRAQKLRKERSGKKMPSTRTTWLLTGLLYCSRCGSRLYGHSHLNKATLKDGTVKSYDCSSYICGGRTANSSSYCRLKQVVKRNIEQVVVNTVREKMRSCRKVYHEKMLEEELGRLFAGDRKSIEKIDKEIEAINNKMDKYYTDYEAGKMEAGVMMPAIKRLQKEQEEKLFCKQQLQSRAELNDRITRETRTLAVSLLNGGNANYIPGELAGAKKAALVQVVNKIWIDFQGEEMVLEIHYNFSESICPESGPGTPGPPLMTKIRVASGSIM